MEGLFTFETLRTDITVYDCAESPHLSQCVILPSVMAFVRSRTYKVCRPQVSGYPAPSLEAATLHLWPR